MLRIEMNRALSLFEPPRNQYYQKNLEAHERSRMEQEKWNKMTNAERKAVLKNRYNKLIAKEQNISRLGESAKRVAASEANNAASVNSAINNSYQANLMKNVSKPNWTKRVVWKPSKSRKNRKNRKATRKNRKSRRN
jgi:predicted Fe-S protein YdhL (DUF1289 family)